MLGVGATVDKLRPAAGSELSRGLPNFEMILRSYRQLHVTWLLYSQIIA